VASNTTRPTNTNPAPLPVSNSLKTALRSRFACSSGIAVEAHADRFTNAESEIARLKANADVLDRAGRQSVVKKEIRETSDIENMSDQELQKELDALLVSQGYIKW